MKSNTIVNILYPSKVNFFVVHHMRHITQSLVHTTYQLLLYAYIYLHTLTSRHITKLHSLLYHFTTTIYSLCFIIFYLKNQKWQNHRTRSTPCRLLAMLLVTLLEFFLHSSSQEGIYIYIFLFQFLIVYVNEVGSFVVLIILESLRVSNVLSGIIEFSTMCLRAHNKYETCFDCFIFLSSGNFMHKKNTNQNEPNL